MTPTHPVALADQLAAAATEALHMLRTADHAGADVVRIPAPTGWLAEQIHQLRNSIQTGAARSCPHLADGPRVIHAAAWAPGLLVCSGCTPRLRPDPAEDATCDSCRRYVSQIHAGALAVGPIILGYGLCHACNKTITDGVTKER